MLQVGAESPYLFEPIGSAAPGNMTSDSILFAVSLVLGLVCIAGAKPSSRIQAVDVAFYLVVWEAFNFGVWERVLAPLAGPYAYDLAAILLMAGCVLLARRRDIHLGLRLATVDVVTALAHLAALTALIPVGLILGFLKFDPRFGWATIGTAAEYFLFVAPAEEIMFRGIVQNLLERQFGKWPALLLTTTLFALIYTHLAGNGAFPNWTYVAFAFACGLAYGHSYLRSRNILVPILVHGSVDTIWRTCLS
jgi:membrane protease YdiL (CAAX protease family)